MFRIGCGAGFSSDRLEPAVDLVREGALDMLVFECIGERTMAFGHRDRLADPRKGYNAFLERRMRAVLPLARAAGTRIVTNMGVANPRAAGEATVAVARELGLSGLRVAVVEGDDVVDLVGGNAILWETRRPLRDLGMELVGANTYLGIEVLLPALASGADVIIAGRIADPSLFLAPMVQRYGWATDDWSLLAAGTLVGHLLECGMQVTGGYFADPGFKDVPDLARCGYPIAEIAGDGTAVITKLPTAGGCVTPATVKEQLLYEVHDPTRYLTPDVTADFSQVWIDAVGPDRVRIGGAAGRRRPEQLKATLAFDGGFLAEAGISYAGPGALARAELARSILRERLGPDPRLDLVGVDALHGTAGRRSTTEPYETRLRAALRTGTRSDAEMLLWEVEALLCCGPAGGAGYRGSITPSVITYATAIDRAAITPGVTVLET